MDDAGKMRFIEGVFTHLGFEGRYEETMQSQHEAWMGLIDSLTFTSDNFMLFSYRDMLYKQKIRSADKIFETFTKLIRDNPALLDAAIEDRNRMIAKQECEICEKQGLVMIPMENRNGQINMRAFRCNCDIGKIRFGGVPEATPDMLHWRVEANRRENEEAREYVKAVGLDPDRPITFKAFYEHLSRTLGPIGEGPKTTARPHTPKDLSLLPDIDRRLVERIPRKVRDLASKLGQSAANFVWRKVKFGGVSPTDERLRKLMEQCEEAKRDYRTFGSDLLFDKYLEFHWALYPEVRVLNNHKVLLVHAGGDGEVWDF